MSTFLVISLHGWRAGGGGVVTRGPIREWLREEMTFVIIRVKGGGGA